MNSKFLKNKINFSKFNNIEINLDHKSFQIYYNNYIPVTPFTFFFIDNFPEVKNRIVLDYGSGAGTLSIACSLLKAHNIYAIDINKQTFKILMKNAKINNANNITTIFNDGNLKNSFTNNYLDLIISNPASFPTAKKTPLYLNSNTKGNKMIFEIIEFGNHALKIGGKIIFIHTSLVPQCLTRKYLIKNNFEFTIKAQKMIPFRDFYIPHIPHFNKLKEKYKDVYFIKKNNIYFENLFLYEANKIK